MQDVFVAGVGMTQFARHPDRNVRSLATEAVDAALADSGATVADVQAVFFSNAVAGLITGQEMIRGQVALNETGLLGVPIVNVENACASASTAFHLACSAVASGQYEVALAVGAEKLSHPEKARTFRAIGSAVDVEWAEGLMKQLAAKPMEERRGGPDGAASGVGEKKPGQDHSLFMQFYAMAAKVYMGQSGATAADFAEIAVKNRAHAALNPHAQFRDIITVEDVLGSRPVADPLTLLMCSPIGDGAAAAVVCSAGAASRLGVTKPVKVAASILRSGRTTPKPGEGDLVERSAKTAYEQAGVGPDDLDVIEVHDAAAPAELMIYEELGLCAKGEGPALLAKGETALGGRHPVNTSGGLLSKGHPIGATGLAQVAELTWQLRGDAGERQVAGAKTALAENAGGFIGLEPAALCIHVLTV